MDIYNELQVGDKIEIELTDTQEKKSPLLSQVAELKQGKIYINSPLSDGHAYRLHDNEKLKFIFYREGKGIYSFLGEIVEKNQVQGSELQLYEIKPISSISKIQRRDHYRFPVIKKFKIESLDKDGQVISGVTKDLSGGGVKIITRNKVEMNEAVKCTVFIEEHQNLEAIGKVIRKEFDPILKEYKIGIEFTEIDAVVRKEIIAFIFEQQRLLRKRGLI
ncbi:type IV pilus assembly PilZ [Alkaliphilus metalliredigens QYMF]|uniref:Type IV pilus assembly PilZ n=1 Tax=Alkaliphilus metalliredigens (strain QYMF) TaxID=293826 RepID=A6TRN4_ALKMQ|nr:PilZ domain-containing protein [Alkaliphilus metalliredigens]ABR48852.1 type IV pilus assembly PilZ [Alkaliphilus metalliredigens QYMF]